MFRSSGSITTYAMEIEKEATTTIGSNREKEDPSQLSDLEKGA